MTEEVQVARACFVRLCHSVIFNLWGSKKWIYIPNRSKHSRGCRWGGGRPSPAPGPAVQWAADVVPELEERQEGLDRRSQFLVEGLVVEGGDGLLGEGQRREAGVAHPLP